MSRGAPTELEHGVSDRVEAVASDRRAAGRGRRVGRAVCLVVIGLLYVASVPWYRDAEAPLRLWLGLPDWVTMALLCYAGVAVVNALAWGWTDVADDDEEPS